MTLFERMTVNCLLCKSEEEGCKIQGLWEEKELLHSISEDCTCQHMKLLVHSQQLKHATKLVEFLGSLGFCRTWGETEATYEGSGAKTEGHPQGHRSKQKGGEARISPHFCITGSRHSPPDLKVGSASAIPACVWELFPGNKVHFSDLYQVMYPHQPSRRAL